MNPKLEYAYRLLDLARPSFHFPEGPIRLECEACHKYLGDNNAPIEHGPHAGARPTDLTTFCEQTGRQERVVAVPAFYKEEQAK